MKDYNRDGIYTHKISDKIAKIEAKFNYEFAQYDIDLLHDVFHENRYSYFTAEDFYRIMTKESYRYGRITKTLTLAGFAKWYNEMLRLNPPVLEIGTHASVYYYSDIRAATVTSIEYYKDKRTDGAGNLIPKRIGVNLNYNVDCKDYYAGDYEVHPITDPEQMKVVKYYFTLRRNHNWVDETCKMRDGLVLGLGYWRHYIDPSF